MRKIFPSSLVFAIAANLIITDCSHALEKYRVVRGDNLSKIGRRYGVHYKEIMAANRLKSTVIYPNQVLVIPSQAGKPVQPQERVAHAAPPQVYARRIQTAPAPPAIKEAPLVSVYQPPAVGKPSDDLEKPFDPIVESYVFARRLPNQKPPDRTTEKPVPTAQPHRVIKPNIAAIPRRGREVPAVAHYPKPNSSPEPITLDINDPYDYPKPSFKTPSRPKATASSTSSKIKSTSSRSRTYRVARGDSLWTISRKFGVSPLKLRRINNLGFSRIKPGMKLTIPESHVLWSL